MEPIGLLLFGFDYSSLMIGGALILKVISNFFCAIVTLLEASMRYISKQIVPLRDDALRGPKVLSVVSMIS